MNFMNNLQSQIVTGSSNVAYTENGAMSYRTSGDALLDLNFSVSSLRNASETTIEQKFAKVFYDNKLLAVKWLFYAGDVREGLGERRLFRIAMKWLAKNEKDFVVSVLPLISEYTRWDNILCLLGTGVQSDVISLIDSQLKEDIKNYKVNEPISLLAKWLPSINASSKKTKDDAKTICKALNLSEKTYRKTLSTLRKYLDVVEVKMSAKNWSEINYNAVPSRANLLYNGAFLRNDEDRRRDFLDKLQRGDSSVKINASVLYPHDIVTSYMESTGYWHSRKVKKYDETLEQLWKNLKDTVGECSNVLCVSDSSGSMATLVSGQVSCLNVANALSIYFAERCSGQFKDKYITFSSRPEFVCLSDCKTLRDKIALASSYNIAQNTNIEKTFQLILDTAVANAMPQEDLPQTVLLISDMQFDSMVDGRPDQRLFEAIQSKFERAGYKMPRIVFWNVAANGASALPVTKHQKFPCALVSGFSTNIVKMVLSGELDPLSCLLGAIDDCRYDAVEEAIKHLV